MTDKDAIQAEITAAEAEHADKRKIRDDLHANLNTQLVAADREVDVAMKRLTAAHRANAEANAPPVDRGARELAGGGTVTSDHTEIDPKTGQQKGYVVLSAAERAKGFVRPVRTTYLHVGINPTWHASAPNVLVKAGVGGCGCRTTMAQEIAETYARDPQFYAGTFCVGCQKHLPLDGFVWEGTREKVGS